MGSSSIQSAAIASAIVRSFRRGRLSSDIPTSMAAEVAGWLAGIKDMENIASSLEREEAERKEAERKEVRKMKDDAEMKIPPNYWSRLR